MDINSLLSPSETPRSISSTPTSPQPSPFKFVQRTQSGPGPSRHGHGASPLSQSVMNQSSIPAHVLSPGPQQVSSPLISPVPATNSSQLARTTSTHSIDTLADLASMQNSAMKATSAHIRNRDVFELSKSPTILNPAVAASLTSNPRASFDINMMETPKQIGRTNFSGTSLSSEQQDRLRRLTEYVQDNPSAYESHVEIIKILHQGLIDHIYPPNESSTRRAPHSYDLLSELRDARESMEKLFAVGEELWIDWLQDESILARTAEERIAVVERCRRAVEEEVGSVALWLTYTDWVRHCYEWAQDRPRDPDAMLDEERMVGRELFTKQLVIDTLREGVDQTALNLVQSHLVWDKYVAFQIPDIDSKLNEEDASLCMALFDQRLQTPHSAWNDTFQTFSSFVSANFDSDRYEQIMSETLRLGSDAKKKWALRESFENEIERAEKSQEREAEYIAFTNYLEWEQTPEKRRKVDHELTATLFQRAELRFPSDATLWEEHVAFLLGRSKPILLPVLERATKHCPWSGSLWSQYLLSSDRTGQAFHETESIKHKATNTGLLEAAGIEEVIKVHGAWCSYLRRRSFRPDGSEEDIDVAEMGIRSSIENVASLAAKLGMGEVSDPAFRLHRIYIIFLSESGRWDNARQEFDNSVRDHGKSWEFWLLFYNWEMGRWRKFSTDQQNTSHEQMFNPAPPHLATAVLKKALDQPNLDYPEPIMQALITHCEDFEDAEELQSAMLKVQKLQKVVAARRQADAVKAVEATGIVPHTDVDDPLSSSGAKRKREEDVDQNSNKKSKNEDSSRQPLEEIESPDLKRDRENATVLVENLPDDITDTRIRQYFSNCGTVRSLKVLRDDGITAIIEFDDDDAARYAVSRDEQELDGAILSVTLDTGSTLYLTNYKPSADEPYIQSLLNKYGEIVSIRFPSLQGNKKRRFCYVQFKLPSAAQAASKDLDGSNVEDYTIVCKVSNPANRQTRRENATNDGHTVFVGQLNFKATEADLSEFFSQYGKIEKLKLPLHPKLKSRNRGIAYVTFDTIEAAEKAADETNGTEFHGRNLTVETVTKKSAGSLRRDSSVRSSTPTQNGDTASGTAHAATANERQVFLSNVPDTVNDARIREVASKHGTVLHIVLKTNHQGAIVEYARPNEAGQASLKLEGHEIAPGRPLRVVSESEMLSKTRELKIDGFTPGKDKMKPTPPLPIGNTAPIKRPQQPGVRRGGHLGQRSSALHQSTRRHDDQANGDDTNRKKNNDEFRAMLKKAG